MFLEDDLELDVPDIYRMFIETVNVMWASRMVVAGTSCYMSQWYWL